MIKDETVRDELGDELSEINKLISTLETDLGEGKAADTIDRLLKAHQIKVDLLEALDTI